MQRHRRPSGTASLGYLLLLALACALLPLAAAFIHPPPPAPGSSRSVVSRTHRRQLVPCLAPRTVVCMASAEEETAGVREAEEVVVEEEHEPSPLAMPTNDAASEDQLAFEEQVAAPGKRERDLSVLVAMQEARVELLEKALADLKGAVDRNTDNLWMCYDEITAAKCLKEELGSWVAQVDRVDQSLRSELGRHKKEVGRVDQSLRDKFGQHKKEVADMLAAQEKRMGQGKVDAAFRSEFGRLKKEVADLKAAKQGKEGKLELGNGERELKNRVGDLETSVAYVGGWVESVRGPWEWLWKWMEREIEARRDDEEDEDYEDEDEDDGY